MQPRLWLASAAAVTVVTGGAYVASPTLHGQAAPKPPASDTERSPAPPEFGDLARDIQRAVDDALAQSGLRDGKLSADVQQAIDQATRHAHELVRDIDVDVLVDDAMQEVTMLAGGRPRLGVSTRDLTTEEAKAAGLDGIAGAYVTEVMPESAAAKAGLQVKDVITTIDGETVRSVRHLSRLINETPEGRALQVGIVRGTARQTVSVTPEARAMTRSMPRVGPDGPTVRRFERRFAPERDFEFRVPGPRNREGGAQEFFFRGAPDGGGRLWVGSRSRLGVMTQSLSGQLATYFGVKEGVLVTQVNENSPAAKAGMKAGDVITAVDGKPVKDAGDIIEHLGRIEAGKTVPVEISRDRAKQTLTVTMATSSSTSDDRPAPRRMRFTA